MLESDKPVVIPTDQIKWRSFYQLATEIVVSQGYSAQLVFDEVINMIFDWVQEKIHASIPKELRHYDDGFVVSITDDHPVLRCATIPQENCWSVRLTQPTPPCEDNHVIPGRTWTTVFLFQVPDVRRCAKIGFTSLGKRCNSIHRKILVV